MSENLTFHEERGEDSESQSSSQELFSKVEQDLITRARKELQNPNALRIADQQHKQLVELGDQYEEGSSEITAEHNAFQEEIEKLDYIEEEFIDFEVPGGDTESSIKNMFSFLGNLSDIQRNEVYDILTEDEFLFDLEDYIMENGFPNDETYKVFLQFLSEDLGFELASQNDDNTSNPQNLDKGPKGPSIIDTIAMSEMDQQKEDYSSELLKERQKSEVVLENEKSDIERSFSNAQEYASLLLTFEGVDNRLLELTKPYRETTNFLDKPSDFWKTVETDITSYFENLAQNPVAFTETLDSLGGPDSELFKATEKLVLASSPGLKADFERYKGEYTSPLPIIQKDVAEEVTRELNDEIIGDYDIAEDYDYSKNPPVRSIGLAGSEYKMKSQPPIGDFYPATVEYTNVTQEVQAKLDSVNALMDYVAGLSTSANIEAVHEQLNSMVPYTMKATLGITNIERFSTIDELKTGVLNLAGLEKEKLEKKRSDARKRYKESLNKVKEAYKKTLRESQEKQQEILTFLRDIGFDKIPQDFTNRIIAQINITKNIDLGRDLQINSDIDIENGEFGVNILGDDTNLEREAFVRLMNLIVTGNAEGENALIGDPASFISQKLIVDPYSMQHLLNKPDGIIGSGGGLDMAQVYKNLGWNGEKNEKLVNDDKDNEVPIS